MVICGWWQWDYFMYYFTIFVARLVLIPEFQNLLQSIGYGNKLKLVDAAGTELLRAQ